MAEISNTIVIVGVGSNTGPNSTVVIVGNDPGQAIIAPVVVGSTQTVAVVNPIQEVVARQPILLSDRALVGPQGAQGIQGIPGDPDTPYAQLIDMVSDSLIYKGQAQPGAVPTAAVWRIQRITIDSGGDVINAWASGNASFDKVWNDRATLVY